MEIAVVCQAGATERNKEFINALFRGFKPMPQLFPVGSLKVEGQRPARPGQRKAGLAAEMAATINSLFTRGCPQHKGRTAWKPDSVIVLWDTDCRDPKKLKAELCAAVSEAHRSKVFVYFAHPEPEIWLLADFDNAFTEYDAKNAAAIKKGLAKRGIRFGNLEGGLAFDSQRKTCVKKISSLVKSAVEEATGGSFRKPEKTPLLMARLDWQAVARALPTFRPLYDEWLSGKSPSFKLGACA